MAGNETKEKIFRLIKQEGPLAQVQITEKMKLARSTVNHYVQLLEAEGRIELAEKIGKKMKRYGVKS